MATRRLSSGSGGSGAGPSSQQQQLPGEQGDSPPSAPSTPGRARAASAAAATGAKQQDGEPKQAGATAFGRARAASAALAARNQPKGKRASEPAEEEAGGLPRAESGASSRRGSDNGAAKPLPARARSILKPPSESKAGEPAAEPPAPPRARSFARVPAGMRPDSAEPGSTSRRPSDSGAPEDAPAPARRPSTGGGMPPLKPPVEKARAGSLGERQQKAVAQNFVKLLRDLERESERSAAAKPVLVPFAEALQVGSSPPSTLAF